MIYLLNKHEFTNRQVQTGADLEDYFVGGMTAGVYNYNLQLYTHVSEHVFNTCNIDSIPRN